MTIDELFIRDEKRTKKLYDTELLAKLLLFSYEFSNNKYLGTTATDVFNDMHNVEYSKNEIQEIKHNAIRLLKIKYNVDVIEFEELNFTKEN